MHVTVGCSPACRMWNQAFSFHLLLALVKASHVVLHDVQHARQVQAAMSVSSRTVSSTTKLEAAIADKSIPRIVVLQGTDVCFLFCWRCVCVCVCVCASPPHTSALLFSNRPSLPPLPPRVSNGVVGCEDHKAWRAPLLPVVMGCTSRRPALHAWPSVFPRGGIGSLMCVDHVASAFLMRMCLWWGGRRGRAKSGGPVG